MMGSLRWSLSVLVVLGGWAGAEPASAQRITWVPTPEAPAAPTEAEAEAPAAEASSEAEADAAAADDAPPEETAADALVLDEAVVEPPATTEGRALAAPVVDPARAERVLRNIAFAEEALREERGGADLTLAVAVNLYVGGALLSVLSVSLLVGIALEAACINGVVDECLDGPGYLAGFIPSALGAAALLIGAYTTEQRASAHYRSLDERAAALEARRHGPRAALEPTVGISLGAGSLHIVGTF